MMTRRQVERRRSRRRRPGEASAFTLLEVILALVILGGALAIFGEVVQLANRSAVDARAETQAQLLASSLMDEIMADFVLPRLRSNTMRIHPVSILFVFLLMSSAFGLIGAIMALARSAPDVGDIQRSITTRCGGAANRLAQSMASASPAARCTT